MHTVKTPIEVRYQETDQMGVVYHSNYLIWFEIGRTKYIEALGLRYNEMEEHGVVSPVVDANISFKRPIRYGEETHVETWLEHYDGVRTIYAYRIINEQEQTAVEGTTTHTIVKKDTFRPLSLRRSFPEWHQAYQRQIEGKK